MEKGLLLAALTHNDHLHSWFPPKRWLAAVDECCSQPVIKPTADLSYDLEISSLSSCHPLQTTLRTVGCLCVPDSGADIVLGATRQQLLNQLSVSVEDPKFVSQDQQC